jgi:hypothetical protein
MTTSLRKDSRSPSSKVIPAHFVQLVDPGAKPAPLPVTSSEVPCTSKGARVTLIKEGDTVKSIEIHCTCGEVIHLDCEY